MDSTWQRDAADHISRLRLVMPLLLGLTERLNSASRTVLAHARTIFTTPGHAKELLKSGLKSIATVLIATVALFLLVPYLSIRGPANKIAKIVGIPPFIG